MNNTHQAPEDADIGDATECALCLAATQAAIASTGRGAAHEEPEMDELSFLRAAVDYYHAALLKRRPLWVPCLVRLMTDVHSDFPIGPRTVAPSGRYEAYSNQWGVVTVLASNGQRLGVKPGEFEPLRFKRNPAAGCQPKAATQAPSAEKAPT